MKEKTKKIGLFGAVLMAIGCIIGSGLFGSFPTGIALCGTGLIWALVIALIRQFVMFVPNVATGNVLPAPSANYMHAAKLIGPINGFLQTMNGLLNITTVSLLATVFALYASSLEIFANVPIKWLAIASIFIFTVVSSFGSKATEWMQNAIVIILLSTLVLYIVKGFPAMSTEYVTFEQIVVPQTTLKKLFAAAAVMGACMQGGEILMNFTGEIDKPRRTIPLAFTISTIIVAILCILIAIVTLGTYPAAELTALSDAAANFMSPAMLTFFVIGGACFACLSTINSVLLSCAHILSVSAEEKIFPQFMSKRNKYDVPIVSLWIVGGGAILVCLLGLDVFTLMTAFTPISTLIVLGRLVPPFIISRRYPNTFKTNFFKLNKTAMDIITILAIILTLIANVSLISELTLTNNLIMLALLVVFYGYCGIRVLYLKKKGVDLVAEMRTPYPEWEKTEQELAAKAE